MVSDEFLEKYRVLEDLLGERFGEWAGVPVSLPCRIGWDGIEKTFMVSMNEEEKAAMENSVKILKEFMKSVKNA